MRIVYSFLPVNERIHLGEVDKTFRDDKARGKIVAVYGEDNLDLLEAFQVLKRWKDFDDSPRSFEPGCSFGSVDPSWFTLEKGYDMQRAETEWTFEEGKVSKERFLRVLRWINIERVDMQEVERSIHELLSRAPMNALLDLLGKYDLLYLLPRQFSDSRRPGRNLSEPLEDDDR